jgi:hypothetical protein
MAGNSAIFTGGLWTTRCIQCRQDGAILQRAVWQNLGVKEESCHGRKHSKDRLTVLLCVNSVDCDWEIPETKCFKNVKKLPTKYHANSKAWMMTEIFCLFLHSLDVQMRVQNRQIILFVDNCAAHPKDTSFLRSVKVVRYPANCTSTLQPLD